MSETILYCIQNDSMRQALLFDMRQRACLCSGILAPHRLLHLFVSFSSSSKFIFARRGQIVTQNIFVYMVSVINESLSL